MSDTNLLKAATHSITAENEVIVTLVGTAAMFIIVVLLNVVINITMHNVCPIDPQYKRLYNERRRMRDEDKYLRPKRSRTPPRKTIGRKRSKTIDRYKSY